MVCAAWVLPGVARAQSQPPKQTWTLQEARARAVSHNLDLVLQRLTRARQALEGDVARRPFVPVVSVSAGVDDDPGFEDGPRARSARWGAGLRWQTLGGTQLDLDAFGAQRLNPQPGLMTSDAAVSLSLTQPLLRGFGEDSQTVRAQDLERERGRAQFVSELNDVLFEVEQAYWDVSLAQQDVQIKKRSLERARAQYEQTKENIKRGLLAEAEIFIVEDNLVLFQQNLLQSTQASALASLRLGRVLRLGPQARPVATQSPQVSQQAPPSAAQALSTGVKAHPDLVAARVSVRQRGVEVGFASNQLKPRLDLLGQVNTLGSEGAFGQAWRQALSLGGVGYGVGVLFEIPLTRAPDYARVERAQLAQRAERARLARLKQGVELQINESLVRLENSRARLALATKRVGLTQSKLETEQQKYARGRSSLDNIVRFQRDVDAARLGQQRLMAQVSVLEAQLARAMGTLYVRAGVRVGGAP